jgi:hypothetical protein
VSEVRGIDPMLVRYETAAAATLPRGEQAGSECKEGPYEGLTRKSKFKKYVGMCAEARRRTKMPCAREARSGLSLQTKKWK